MFRRSINRLLLLCFFWHYNEMSSWLKGVSVRLVHAFEPRVWLVLFGFAFLYNIRNDLLITCIEISIVNEYELTKYQHLKPSLLFRLRLSNNEIKSQKKYQTNKHFYWRNLQPLLKCIISLLIWILLSGLVRFRLEF